jgi:N,N'-diacetylchitobiose non-reducing end deacetylase
MDHAAVLLGARRPLLVQPHYDDNDIGAAGTVRRWVLAGADVTYVSVTDDVAGVLDPHLDDDDARTVLRAEQARAGALLGVARQVRLDWPDAGGLEHVALRDQVIDLIRDVQPDLVCTVDPWLPDEAHQDHVRTGLAVAEAALLAGLPRVRRSTGDRAWSVSHLALYDTAGPNVVIDTSAVQAERHAVLDCYTAQFTPDDLAALHIGLDRYERALATAHAVDGTHGEGWRVRPMAALHIGRPKP